MADDLSALTHYVNLIRAAMPRQIGVPSANRGRHAVESGVVFAAAMMKEPVETRLFAPSSSEDLVADVLGHQRPHYRGLMLYCVAQARRMAPASLSDGSQNAFHPWRDLLLGAIREHPLPDAPIPAAQGAAATRAAWDALALTADGSLEVGAVAFSRLARHQHPDGSFLRPAASNNPETFWFHELVLLHAAASYAALTGDPSVQRAVIRHTEWVQRETQPDHATSDPWGLHAFAQNPETHPTADALLHAVRMQHPQGTTGVGLMLLADALYCLLSSAEGMGQR